MAKTYRTAKGKTVDLGAIMAKNEKTRAVGNMNVNARGDTLDSQNKSIQNRNKQLRKQYRRQIGEHVVDDAVYASKAAAEKALKKNKKENNPVIEETNEVLNIAESYAAPETMVSEPEPVIEDPAFVEDFTETPAKGGLAAAIAKAREVKQEPLKSPRQQARSTTGVKKI